MTRLRFFVLAVGLVLAAGVGPAGVSAAQASRTIYVSVMDSNGAPVGDMKQDEFSVKEDGEARTITKVERASEPIHYVIMVDTTPTMSGAVNDIRDGIKGFSTLLLSVDPKSQFSFVEFGGAAITVMDFTSEQAKIDASLGKLMPKPSVDPVLNEALVDVAKKLAAMPPTTRKVIITINLEPTRESSNVLVKQVAEEVRKSGAIVWSVVLQEGTRRDANRENLLKGLTVNTGGRWVVLQGPARTNLGNVLRSVAANSFSQYAVTYTQDAAKPAKITDVTVARPGVLSLSMKWSR